MRGLVAAIFALLTFFQHLPATHSPPPANVFRVDPISSPRATPSRASRDRTAVYSRMMSVTAYCATGSRDADGTWPQVGYAATLDRSIPFGTHMLVPGYGEVVVHDRIGHGSDLDLYMGDTGCAARADAWGRHYLHVEWLD